MSNTPNTEHVSTDCFPTTPTVGSIQDLGSYSDVDGPCFPFQNIKCVSDVYTTAFPTVETLTQEGYEVHDTLFEEYTREEIKTKEKTQTLIISKGTVTYR